MIGKYGRVEEDRRDLKKSNKIYNLDYELLTVNHEIETQRLIQHIGLGWDQKCLKPCF